jgi:choline dehydrogenase-like flavoprotein
MTKLDPDILIIGSGMGGSSLAHALRGSGLRVHILERGGYLPREDRNWSVEAVFHRKHYRSGETWRDQDNRAFSPNQHYFVGGSSKVYGACMMRFRPRDFEAVEHHEGLSPAWPITYDDLEPWYCAAEAMMKVRGEAGLDPTEGPRGQPYTEAPIAHDPPIGRLFEHMRARGQHPFPLPASVQWGNGGGCIRCKTCDGFPCKVDAKGDAENCALRPALVDSNITIETGAKVLRLITTPDGRKIDGVEVEVGGTTEIRHAPTVVLAAGAINSALLMQRSANAAHPNGLANGSGQLGRNYMAHHLTAMMCVDPFRTNDTVYQKTISLNDYYWGMEGFRWPMGNMQMLGKLQAGMLTAEVPLVPNAVMQALSDRSIDWLAMSEDLPDPENRVLPDGAGVRLIWRLNNRVPNRRLAAEVRKLMRSFGAPLVFEKHGGIATTSHQCGTLRMGHDPATSVLDPLCRTWEIENLYVVDGSFFVSSAAVNPSLTIAAQALRVGAHLRGKRA